MAVTLDQHLTFAARIDNVMGDLLEAWLELYHYVVWSGEGCPPPHWGTIFFDFWSPNSYFWCIVGAIFTVHWTVLDADSRCHPLVLNCDFDPMCNITVLTEIHVTVNIV